MLSKKYAYVIHLHSDKRQGRGRALNRAFKAASGEVLCYIDVDLATDMKYLEKLVRAVSVDGYDFATGSRMMPESDAKRPFKREFASRGYNFLVRLFLRSKLYDHQCGFKAFRREALFELLDEIENQHWFWDTELLVRAQHKGYRVMEFPVYWRHGGSSKVNLVKDVGGMGSEIFRLWRELSFPRVHFRKRKNFSNSHPCSSDPCICCNLSGCIRYSGKCKACILRDSGPCLSCILYFLASPGNSFPADS